MILWYYPCFVSVIKTALSHLLGKGSAAASEHWQFDARANRKSIEGSRKLKNRCEYWVQSETLYVTNSFKKSIPVTRFLGIPECRQVQCLGSWELRAFMMTTQDMLCYMIRNMSANELSHFLMWSSSVSLANQGTNEYYMNESCLKTSARCSCEYKRNEWV